VALAVCSARWGWGLRAKQTEVIRMGAGWSWGRALGISVAVACVPGLVLVGIPPLLVALTGLMFVPAMFGAMRRRVVRERQALDEA
jgi:hypothetical protein